MMKMLWILAAALAAAAAAAGLKNRQAAEADPYHPQAEPVPEAANTDETVPADDADDEGEPLSPSEAVPAQVISAARAMDPVTFTGASRVTFRLPGGSEKRLLIPGDSGTHLYPGDSGMLAFSGDQFICFEKENGEIVGALYYMPAPEEDGHE